MNKQTIISLVIGLVIGITTTYGISRATSRDDQVKTNTPLSISTADHNASASSKLKGLNGDEFDKAFMEEMIQHHQGAIDMAKLIETNGKHDELKKLGQDILSAQSKEIDMMQTWQSDWGYKTVPKSHEIMSH